jgi:hypothetical protein
MVLAVGSAPVADVRYGGASVAAVHLGAEKVWPVGPTGPLLRDDFNRSDRNLDNPPVGPPVSIRSGTWRIEGNTVPTPNELDAYVMWDVGVDSYTLKCALPLIQDCGIVVRGPQTGKADLVLLNYNNHIYTRTAGGNWVDAGVGSGTPRAGDTVTITVTPTRIAAEWSPSGATVTADTTLHAHQTCVGFRGNGGASGFDDLEVTP